MSINSLNSYSNSIRLSGLATGIDTDQMVSDLMTVERIPLDRLYQKKQLAEWKRDDYRNIVSSLSSFRNKYLNYVNSSVNMLSQSSYNDFNVSSIDSVTGISSSVVSVSDTSNAYAGTHTLIVNRLATADEAVSTSAVTADLKGIPLDFSLSGKNVRISLDEIEKEFELDNYSDLDNLINKADTGLQALIDDAYGSGKVILSNNSGELKIETAGGASKIILYSGTENDGLSDLGFISGESNRLNLSLSLEDLADKFASVLTFDINDQLVFTVNNEEFTFDKTTSLYEMISIINSNSSAQINIRYDEITDKFKISASQTGAGNNISISQIGGSFFDGASCINSANPVTTEGEDSEVELDGETITRNSNTFTVNGIKYSLLSTSVNTQNITLTRNTEAIFDNIVDFVNNYNEMIDLINTKLTEEYDRDYQPLTEAQKEDMNDDDVDRWEGKAKTGLLRNDSLLENIVYNMRRAFYDEVEDVDITLSSIGITTGTYSNKGKLVIDETAFKEALNSNTEAVMQLFSKQSDIEYTDTADRETRYNEQGIAYRLYDIIQDNIRTTRDENGYKGSLIEKAGMIGDASQYTNILYKEINDYESRIDALYNKLIEKEESYYKQFTILETAINEMNMQSNWLTTQLGLSGS